MSLSILLDVPSPPPGETTTATTTSGGGVDGEQVVQGEEKQQQEETNVDRKSLSPTLLLPVPQQEANVTPTTTTTIEKEGGSRKIVKRQPRRAAKRKSRATLEEEEEALLNEGGDSTTAVSSGLVILGGGARKRRGGSGGPPDILKSKFLGVSWDKHMSRWRTKANGIHIGYFALEDEAAKAYDEAKLAFATMKNKPVPRINFAQPPAPEGSPSATVEPVPQTVKDVVNRARREVSGKNNGGEDATANTTATTTATTEGPQPDLMLPPPPPPPPPPIPQAELEPLTHDDMHDEDHDEGGGKQDLTPIPTSLDQGTVTEADGTARTLATTAKPAKPSPTDALNGKRTLPSHYKGVWRDSVSGTFRCKLKFSNRVWYLGTFPTEADAGRNYDLCARFLGFETGLNFPDYNYSELPSRNIPEWVIQAVKNKDKKHSEHGMHGVRIDSNGGENPWNARVSFEFHDINVGFFPTKTEAARAHNFVATSLLGERARLNDLASDPGAAVAAMSDDDMHKIAFSALDGVKNVMMVLHNANINIVDEDAANHDAAVAMLRASVKKRRDQLEEQRKVVKRGRPAKNIPFSSSSLTKNVDIEGDNDNVGDGEIAYTNGSGGDDLTNRATEALTMMLLQLREDDRW